MITSFSRLLPRRDIFREAGIKIFAIVALVVGATSVVPTAGLQAAPGDITGNVFRDYNADGERSNGNVEPGIEGVEVYAFDVDNNLIAGPGAGGSWLTNADGDYTVTGLSASQPVRLEFRIPSALDFLHPGPAGPGSLTTVVFATADTSQVNVGFNNPGQYCQNNPDTATSCFVVGPYNGANTSEPALVSIPYDARGHDHIANPALSQTSKLANHGDLGTVYGLAYQSTTERLYAAAYYKRFSGFGQGGPDAIYQLDTNGNITGIINLATLAGGSSAGTDAHDFTVVPGSGGEILDGDSYGKVGVTSFGDLEISDDQSTIFVVNLSDQTIYGIDVSAGSTASASVIGSWPVPNTCDPEILHRPFGLGVNDGALYVGTVCEDASKAYVHSLDASSGLFQLEITIPLNYDRELVADSSVEAGGAPADNPQANWNEWSDDPNTYFTTYISGAAANGDGLVEIAFPQPVLSDIEFDNGHMALGIRDRFGDQTGYAALQTNTIGDLYSGVTAGDILRVCNVNGTWEIESGASGNCTASQGDIGATASSGPSGPEYYYWDFFGRENINQNLLAQGSTVYHFETSGGGLLQIPGAEHLLATVLDPFVFASAGYVWLDNETGQRQGVGSDDVASPEELDQGGYTIFVSPMDPDNPDDPDIPTFGKANGLGDIEAMCNQAPIEVGNRVWYDGNGNGIQDANEAALAGVIVGLYNGSGSLITTATTDGSGNYTFSSAPGTTTASAIYGIAALQPESNYTVGLLNSNFAAGSVLDGYRLTLANNDPTIGGDVRDSDGRPIATVGTASGSESSRGASFSTGVAGANDHTFDFGLVASDYGDLPESNTSFSTTGSAGASHQIISGVYLGNGVDRDADGQPNVTASGDDDDSNDDEDGVTFLTPMLPGQTAQILVTASVNGYLNAWIDFDGNLMFDAGEQIMSDQQLNTGSNTLSFAVPASASGVMYSRFRFSTDLTFDEMGPTDSWPNGEVEDYVLSAIGDRLWLDDGSGTGGVGGDGIQNGSEPGVPGVAVNLLSAANQPIVDVNGNPISVNTGPNGIYTFPGLPPGDYRVAFTEPAGMSFTLANAGPENTDSDADPQTGVTDAVTLAPAEFNPDVDAGLVRTLSLGDLVWNDLDNDGVVNGSETGIAGVNVTLWTADSTGSPSTAIDSQTTDANGLYLFTQLVSGDYIVQVNADNFAAGAVLENFVSSTGNGIPAPDPDNDVNNDDNGDSVNGQGTLSQPVTLQYHDEPADDGDGDTSTNLTVDFGFFLAQAEIDIEKDTNGEDADTGTGPLVGIGSNVTWTYVVRNTGTVALADIRVTDNIAGVNPLYVEGDTNNDQILQTTETWIYRDTGVAIAGQYENISRVIGDPVDNSGNPILDQNNTPLPPVEDSDPSHYFGLNPSIDLEKATNGPGQAPQDADAPTGPGIPAGEEVTWTYVIQNTGNVALANVSVTDDIEGSICTIPLLAIGATQTCTHQGIAQLGQYANVGTVSGEPVTEDGTPIPGPNNEPLPPVRDSDPSHYFGNGPASIDIEKDTNGEDADSPTGPAINVGAQVIWTYVIRNTGDFDLANVVVGDNIPGVNPQYVEGDLNNDRILQLNEEWIYRATGVATLGQYANIGSTSGDPVDTNGTPVTDVDGQPLPSPQDSDPSHYFGTAEADIDLQKTVYEGHDDGAGCPGLDLLKAPVGTDITYCFVITNTGLTYLTDVTLTDNDLGIDRANVSLLSGTFPIAPGESVTFYYETSLVGNLVNLATTSGQPSDEDENPIPGLGKVTDEDIAEVRILAAIGDYVWLDMNANGIQDQNEAGVANVAVALYNGTGAKVADAVTDQDGFYLFDRLDPGNYSVGFTLPTVDHFFSPRDNSDNDAIDSDADPNTGRTELTELIGGETDITWDAGIFAPPMLQIQKTADVESVQPGQVIVYSFSYSNDGLSDATGVRVIETVPEYTTPDLENSADGWECRADIESGRYTCIFEIDVLKANSEGDLDITFTVNVDKFLPEDVTILFNEVRIEDDGSKGNQPVGASVDTHQVNVQPPTAIEPAAEPVNMSPTLYLPFMVR